jgi:hypothetical protein
MHVLKSTRNPVDGQYNSGCDFAQHFLPCAQEKTLHFTIPAFALGKAKHKCLIEVIHNHFRKWENEKHFW